MKPTKNQPDPAPKPGIYRGVDEDQYHRWAAFNWSTMKLPTPAHIKALRETPNKPSSGAQELGTLVHKCMLEPEAFHPSKIVEIDRTFASSTRGRKFDWASSRDDWEWARNEEAEEAREEGREPRQILPKGGLEDLQKALRPFYKNPLVKEIFDNTEREDKEISLVWEDPRTGLIMKARIDLAPKQGASKKLDSHRAKFLLDIKSTRRTNEYGFARDVFYYDYHGQAAHYTEGWMQLTGENRKFAFVPLYKDDLWPETQLRPMDETYMELGRTRWQIAVETLAEAVASDRWPGRDYYEELAPPGAAMAMFSDGEELGGV